LRREKDELGANSDRLARSFKPQRGELLRKQDQKHGGFDKRWWRKREQTAMEAARELSEQSRAIEHRERDLAEAKKGAAVVLRRIGNNERVAHIPLQSRPVASPRRF
jgi:hypothetical protein